MLEGLGWQANTASIATNTTIGVASYLPLSINSLARWARWFSWPQVGTVLEVVVWVWWRRGGADYGWSRSACLSWSAGAWSNVLVVKPQVKSHSPFGFSLAPSGLDSMSFQSPHLFLVPDSRAPGISVTSGVFVILEVSWGWTCQISLSGIQTGEVESCRNTQAYPLPQVSNTSGPFHSLVRRSFHLTRGEL